LDFKFKLGLECGHRTDWTDSDEIDGADVREYLGQDFLCDKCDGQIREAETILIAQKKML
jgi:hypothetical protein